MKPKSLLLFVLLGGILLLTTMGCAVLPTSSTQSSTSSSTQSSTSSTSSQASVVATPTFDPPGGTYISNQSVSISCTTPDAKVYYTLDGTTPNSSGTLLTNNISVFSSNTTIKVIAVKSGMSNSQVATATYSLTYPFLKWAESWYGNGLEITGVLGNPSSLVIPSTISGGSVISIGWGAFYGSSELTKIVIPGSVTSINDEAFANCTKLTNISVDSSNTNFMDINGVLFNKGVSKLIKYPIGRNEPSYTITNSVTFIEHDAFNWCTGLTNITIPNSVTSIEHDAFNWCTGLTNITIPNSITNIEYNVFMGCVRLAKITVESTNPPSLGWAAFDWNATGRKIYVPSGSVSTYKSTGNWTNYASDITNY